MAGQDRSCIQLSQYDSMQHMQRMILLQMIDTAWKEHLYDLDQIKKGIGLRAYGQKDPLIEYQRESFKMFEQIVWALNSFVNPFK